tara:strand:- start:166 stop:342 length:177 start_codon:yes stop_codon:yes gene_type:complete
MELMKYIQAVGDMIPNSIHILTSGQLKGKDYDIANGKYEYPTTFKQLFKNLKGVLWRK